ncbi:MAG TPA: NAD(P)H-quinone oxidoreductase [Acidiferrobacteraceae bacterium]|nr:NAD(P)H-quinone oxidoreductase [Acidiferrobacteraceae bacterium]
MRWPQRGYPARRIGAAGQRVGGWSAPDSLGWCPSISSPTGGPTKYIAYSPGCAADALTLAEGPVPLPGAGELLIEVACAGVNRPDLLQRAGHYPPPVDASPVLGLEVSGTVAALGAGVSEWKVGDAVTALAPGGGYAEYCAVPSQHALRIPTGMTLADAAALPENWFTVWANLMDLALLKPREHLLVHGGSSGIGLTAIHLAKHLGVLCTVTVGSDQKAHFCRAFGAASAVNYRTTDFAQAVRAQGTDGGIDVVLDIVGVPYLGRNLELLRPDGRLVFLAFMGGSEGMVDLAPILRKRLLLTGSTMRARTRAEKHAIRDALAIHIWPELDHGKLLPYIYTRFPLAEAGRAHALMEEGTHVGKILLQVAPHS